MGRPLLRLALPLTLVASLLVGCSADTGGGDATPAGPGATGAPSTSATSSTATSGTATPSAAPSPTASTRPGAAAQPGRTLRREPPPPVSLAAYYPANRDYDGRGLRLGAVREQAGTYTSYDASYRSEGLRISGVLNVPRGPGPFPAVVLAHGYIDPDYYTRGQGMTRERGYLATRGFVALHVDYRAHGASGGTELRAERRVRLGYVADVLNAAEALRRSDEVPVDGDRVALFGRSMGGGVTLRALTAAPGAFDAGVAWASVSSREDESFDRWTRDGRPEVADFLAREHGLPGTPRGRDFWTRVSARPAFDRVADPVLLVHGRDDTTCPPRWARATQRALARAGADSRLAWYDDGHAFGPAFEPAMARTVAFLRARLA